MVSCEFCEICKSTFFAEHIGATASGQGPENVSAKSKNSYKNNRPHVLYRLKVLYILKNSNKNGRVLLTVRYPV